MSTMSTINAGEIIELQPFSDLLNSYLKEHSITRDNYLSMPKFIAHTHEIDADGNETGVYDTFVFHAASSKMEQDIVYGVIGTNLEVDDWTPATIR